MTDNSDITHRMQEVNSLFTESRALWVNTVLWASHTIQPSSFLFHVSEYCLCDYDLGLGDCHSWSVDAEMGNYKPHPTFECSACQRYRSVGSSDSRLVGGWSVVGQIRSIVISWSIVHWLWFLILTHLTPDASKLFQTNCLSSKPL